MERFRNSIRKMWSVCTKIALIEKIRRQLFVVYVLIYPIWGQSDKFPVSLSYLRCPLQVKKFIRENSAKYVNRTGNFYSRRKT